MKIAEKAIHNVSRREVSHDEIELPVTHIY